MKYGAESRCNPQSIVATLRRADSTMASRSRRPLSTHQSEEPPLIWTQNSQGRPIHCAIEKLWVRISVTSRFAAQSAQRSVEHRLQEHPPTSAWPRSATSQNRERERERVHRLSDELRERRTRRLGMFHVRCSVDARGRRLEIRKHESLGND
jgi:hypothetical protein